MGAKIRALIAEGARDVLQLYADLIVAPFRVALDFIRREDRGNHHGTGSSQRGAAAH